MRSAHLMCVCLALAGCGDPDSGDAPTGGLTPGEAAQLERAAERIDAQAPGPGAAAARELEEEMAARLAQERAQASR